jgi:membrane protease subunit (stomatin/prohibitin family)
LSSIRWLSNLTPDQPERKNGGYQNTTKIELYSNIASEMMKNMNQNQKPSSESQPAAAAPSASGGKSKPNFCPNCGAKNEGANFCPNCGQKLN